MIVDVLTAVNMLFHDRIPIQMELQMMGKQKRQCKTQMFSANVTTLCSLDRLCGMVDVYIYIIRVVNI